MFQPVSYVDMLLMITRLAPQKSSEKGIADDERGIGFAPQLDVRLLP